MTVTTHFHVQHEGFGRMHGPRRVITFCILTAVLPTILLVIPLYLRHSVFADVTYPLSESDVVEISDGISSIFCQGHGLKMNNTFSAYQLQHEPAFSNTKKQVHLRKQMTLPDDTLEYWGFYLLTGSTVTLSVCSRYDGGHLMIVKGEKNLKTCGLYDHSSTTKKDITKGVGVPAEEEVYIVFETDGKTERSQSKIPTTKNGDKQDPAVFESTETREKAKKARQKLDKISYDDEYEDEELEDDDDEEEDKEDFEEIKRLLEEIVNHSPNGKASQHRNADLRNNNRNLRHMRRKIHELYQGSRSDDTVTEHDPMQVRNREKEKENLRRNLEHPHRSRKRSKVHDNNNDENSKIPSNPRHRRNADGGAQKLDGAIEHGGNAINYTEPGDDVSSESSFEMSLQLCYGGDIVFQHYYPPSHLCRNSKNTELAGIGMKTNHTITSNGYYYYVFFSDNDLESNDIIATFDIEKVTYEYSNFSQSCVNKSECVFPISFLSEEHVIVVVPTHFSDNINSTFLTSSCYPRMSVYIIFPVAVLLLILACAFL